MYKDNDKEKDREKEGRERETEGQTDNKYFYVCPLNYLLNTEMIHYKLICMY